MIDKKKLGAPVRIAADSDNPITRARLRLGGISQAELAEMLGVAKNTISRWEIGKRKVPDMAKKMLDIILKEKQ